MKRKVQSVLPHANGYLVNIILLFFPWEGFCDSVNYWDAVTGAVVGGSFENNIGVEYWVWYYDHCF